MTPAELYEGHEKAWKYTYSASAMATRYLKSRIQTPVWWIANMGYRFYAHHLKDFYNCDWIIGQLDERPVSPVFMPEPALEMALPMVDKEDNAPCG